jgi:hypothetical protein
MLVLSFAVEGADNCAEVDGVPYVYVRTAQGSMVTPALCVHRGGPLHLATAKSGGTFLVCPWHGQATATRLLFRRSIPAVRRGGVVTAVFPVPADTPVRTTHRPMSPDLCAPRVAKALSPNGGKISDGRVVV